jgi:site-specific recombinase XerD
VSRVNTPDRGELAGRWLSRFLIDHLAGERDLSPQTISSYRDAIKLLLTWFRDVQGTPPEKLRLQDLDRARVLAFLDWLETERGNSPATRNQRLAVIKSFARYTAVERPEFLDRATGIIAVRQKKTPATDMGYLTGDEVKALLTEPARPGDPARAARHPPALHALRHGCPRPRDLRPEHRRRPRVAVQGVVGLV